MKTRNKVLSLALVLALALGLGFGLQAFASTGTLSQEEINSIVNTQTDKSQVTSPIIQMADKASQSVVGVNNYQTSRRSQFGYGFGFPFEQEQPNEQQGRESLAGTGSGTVISSFGHVLTNFHVIDGANRVSITVGEKEYAATVVGSDSDLDIAVLLAPGLNLPAAPLGDSDQIQVGEYAVVIGNPLGKDFERSVTVGYVSAVSRTMSETKRDRYGLRTTNENQMIQVDAAISSGNSGGALFNILGQLQGIPTLKFVDGQSGSFFSTSRTSVDNIGMCVPINVAKPLIQSVLQSYNAQDAKAQAEKDNQAEQAGQGITGKPRLGVRVGTMSASYLPVAQGILPQGAYVSEVEANSPAKEAGLQAGDIIVEANSTVLSGSEQLVSILSGLSSGDSVSLKVYRVPGLTDALNDMEKINALGQGQYLDLNAVLRVIDPVGT